MNKYSILNSSRMKEQSTSIIKDLQDSNNELKNLKEVYKRISENQEVQGEAAKNMKEHMLNYLNFIDAMISANDIDIEDHNTLCSLLGDKYYDGALIKEQEDLWLSEKARDEKERDDSYNKWMNSDNTPLGIAMFYYHYFRYCMFDLQVKNDEKEYQRCYADELAFDEISENTSELFTRSPEIRKIARDNINNMLLSLESGNYKSDVIDLNWKDKYMDQLQAKWYKYDEEGNKIIDAEKIKSDLDRADELSEDEFEALLLLCKDNDIQLGENVTRENVKERVFTGLKSKMESGLTDSKGNLISCPYEELDYEQRYLYVILYEENNKEHKESMENIYDQFKESDYPGWEEDINNIKFFTYTANEPYKSLYLKYAPRIEIVTFDYKGKTQFYRPGEGIFLNHEMMDGRMYGYNTFFHECTHNIDYLMGQEYEIMNGTATAGKSYSYYYTSNGTNLQAVLYSEVDRRIDEKIDNYERENNVSLTESQREELKDNIFNMVDSHSYSSPIIEDNKVAQAYDYVVKEVKGELKGSSRDTYGAFSGNTFCRPSEGGYHDALRCRNDKEDANGNMVPDYRIMWANGGNRNEYGSITEDGKVTIKLDNDEEFQDDLQNSKGTMAQEIIDSAGNIVYRDSIAKEFTAENMASNMTREAGDEDKANRYFYDETRNFYEGMIQEMVEHE